MNIWDQFRGYFADGLRALADAFSFLGSHRWAAAVVALTLIVRTLVLPLAIKQIRSMRETQRLQPELQRLRQKYRDDRQKMTQETMELFKREGVNPYASCLPMVAQMPIFFAMFYTIRDELPKVAMPFLGLGDLKTKASGSAAGIVLLAIMTLAQLISTRQLNPGQTDQQRRMQMFLPLLFIVFMINFPTALVLYWATQSTYQLVQQIIMTRNMPDAGLRLPKIWPFTKSQDKRKKTPAKTPAAPVQASMPVAGGSGLHDADARRQLAEKRKRRRRKKKKRR
ncbi:MAG TPA: YidC/Oxa1 family membrane protein insertase [Actinomycetota bacterium]|nr:YidC/Oxa1 family membrane protein insertase [Actinomycetota bacterium]